MTYQHEELAAGRWARMPLVEQLANIGSEVERALNWKAKSNPDYSLRAAERALELSDYFYGTNQHGSTDASLRKYFAPFTHAARRLISRP